MEEYFLILITKYRDGTATKKAIYTYDSIDEALAAYHSEMSKAMKLANLEKVSVFVLDEDGIYRQEAYIKPIEAEA